VHAPADPRLTWKVSGDPTRLDGAVLLLHGGKSESYDPVGRADLAAARMRPFAGAILRRSGSGQRVGSAQHGASAQHGGSRQHGDTHRHGDSARHGGGPPRHGSPPRHGGSGGPGHRGRAVSLAVGLLRDRYRGWNGTEAEPLRDALWALEETERLYGPIPVVLVGHSMGGRAALRAGGYRTVRAVAALCPWLPESEPFAQLAGRTVLIAHAVRDEVTDPAASLRYAQRATLVADEVRYRHMTTGGHAMVRGAGQWHRLVADFVVEQVGSRTQN